MQKRNLLILAALAVMTNGFSLFGIGQASVGSVARTIECNHSIARNLELKETLQRIAGNPPAKRDMAFAGQFILECFS
nr:hypothetical protein [Pseudomonas cavernicola]